MAIHRVVGSREGSRHADGQPACVVKIENMHVFMLFQNKSKNTIVMIFSPGVPNIFKLGLYVPQLGGLSQQGFHRLL